MQIRSKLAKMLRDLAGASEDVIKHCPDSERRKFVSIGLAMFIPPFIGGITIGYIIYTFCHNPYLAWGISFLIWSPIILIIDQALIGTFRRPDVDRNPIVKGLTYARSVVPRFFIALLLGTVMAVPAELLIFHGPIQNHIKMEHQEQLSKVRQKYFSKNDELRDKISNLQDEIDEQEDKFDQFSYLYSSEIHGDEATVGDYSTSGISGKGVQAEQFREMRDSAEERFEEIKNQNNPIISRLRNQIAENKELMKQESSSLEKTQSTSFLYQLKALQDLSKDYPLIKYFKWIVLAMVLCLETIPVFIRVTASRGMYDEIINTDEYESYIDHYAKRKARLQDLQHLTKLNADEITLEKAKDSYKRKLDLINDFVHYYMDISSEHAEDSEVDKRLQESFDNIMRDINSTYL